MQAWGKDQDEPPLKISVSDNEENTPFSLAFLRGHYDVAAAILEIVLAQYSPEERDATRYKLDNGDAESDEDETCESDADTDDEPKIVTEIVGKKFTIENIGQVSMQVKSTVKPLEVLTSRAQTFQMENGRASTATSRQTLFNFVLDLDDQAGLKALIDMGTHFAGQKLVSGGQEEEEDIGGRFSFPEDDFMKAVRDGKTAALAQIISRTGAGIPLDDLVKKSGVEMKRKPKFYQGLTVYGKKR